MNEIQLLILTVFTKSMLLTNVLVLLNIFDDGIVVINDETRNLHVLSLSLKNRLKLTDKIPKMHNALRKYSD